MLFSKAIMVYKAIKSKMVTYKERGKNKAEGTRIEMNCQFLNHANVLHILTITDLITALFFFNQFICDV